MSDIAHLKSAMSANDFVVLDTETTDKYPSSARIVQIAVIDSAGNTLLDTLVNPQVPITNSWIHGITDDMVAAAPSFAAIWQQLFTLLHNRQIVVYNAEYDIPLILAEVNRSGLGGSINQFKAACAMKAYAEYVGDLHPYYGNFKYKKLSEASETAKYTLPEGLSPHSALSDCLTTLAVCRYLEALK